MKTQSEISISVFRGLAQEYKPGSRDVDYVMADLIKNGLILANKIDPQKEVSVPTTAGEIDDLKYAYDDIGYKFDHFTIGRGKAAYHFLWLADNSCGLYYAGRCFKDGVGCRRSVEPNKVIVAHFLLR